MNSYQSNTIDSTLNMKKQRRRKAKINHGLQINEDYDEPIHFELPASNINDVRPRRHAYIHFDQDQYLRAVFQFLVPIGVSKLEWSQVIEVHLYDNQSLLCPICLSDPVAGKITRCGHIFCLPCVLQYFSDIDGKIGSCPVCWKNISLYELRSIQIFQQRTFKSGQLIDFVLMKRCNQTRLIEPVCGKFYTNEIQMPFNGPMIEVDNVSTYKVQQNQRERLELEFRLQSDLADDASLSAEFDKLALNNLKNETETDDMTDCTLHNSNKLVIPNLLQENTYTFFYQSSDGQRIYLHPINVKCLIQEYSYLKSSPWHLKARILSLESKFITSDTIHLYRYLNHIPIGSEFKLVEIDLKGIISDQTYEQFADKIKFRRQHERNEEFRNQQNYRINLEREEKKLLEALKGRRPSPEQIVPGQEAFPAVSSPIIAERMTWPCSFAEKANKPESIDKDTHLVSLFSACNVRVCEGKGRKFKGKKKQLENTMKSDDKAFDK